jgi:hypothetical protein
LDDDKFSDEKLYQNRWNEQLKEISYKDTPMYASYNHKDLGYGSPCPLKIEVNSFVKITSIFIDHFNKEEVMHEHKSNLNSKIVHSDNSQVIHYDGNWYLTSPQTAHQDANLQDANLQDANLQDANLQDANLQETNLQDANLQALHYDANGYSKISETFFEMASNSDIPSSERCATFDNSQPTHYDTDMDLTSTQTVHQQANLQNVDLQDNNLQALHCDANGYSEISKTFFKTKSNVDIASPETCATFETLKCETKDSQQNTQENTKYISTEMAFNGFLMGIMFGVIFS